MTPPASPCEVEPAPFSRCGNAGHRGPVPTVREVATRSLYGVRFRSELDLPELPAAPGDGGVDVTVGFGPVDPGAPDIDCDGCAFSASGDVATLSYAGVGRFLVRGGRQVVIDPEPAAADSELRFFVLGPVTAMLLHQRGLLPLHASSVSIGGAAALFVGFSGRGKSTLTAYLCGRGHRLIADDISPIDSTVQGAPVVIPGFAQVRLLPESFGVLADAAAPAGATVHPRTDKYAWEAAEPPVDRPVPVRRIYLITDGDDLRIEPLARNEAFGQLVASTYPVVARRLGAAGAAATAAHFRQCAAVAAGATVARLIRPRSLARLPDLADLIERDMATANAAAPAAAGEGV